MKATLILTPNVLNQVFTGLSVKEDNVGFIPPLSLLYVASIMKKEGVEVDIIDMETEYLSYEETLGRVRNFKPDFLGFSLSTYSFKPILYWIKKLKEDTALPIMVGGAHVQLYPKETMSHKEIDFAIVGEAEIPLPHFIRAFRSDKYYHGIKSLCFRDNGETIIDTTLQNVMDINELPYPSRHLIKNELYSCILSKTKNFTAMISSRGCPYRCAFCNQNHPEFRLRSAENFYEEILYNYTTYNIREFDIYDSTFTAKKQRVIDICNLIVKEGIKIGWTVRSRVDSVNEEVIDSLKKAGCHTIMYGIESSSPEILEKMRKDISPERVRKIVEYTHKTGIDILGFFMFGFPGETHETIRDTIKFSLELPLDYAQYTVLVPFPGTEIYNYYRANGLEDYWSNYTIDPENEREIALIGTELTRQEASKYLSEAYRKFYFRPRIIWKRAIQASSLSEFKRLSRGAISILKNCFD